MQTPTRTSYPELEQAYNFFNACLFDKALPPVLLTLQRKSSRVMGYFSPNRFVSSDGHHSDELAMNPQHFLARDIELTLSTLVHEMVHVWQQHFGKPGRRGYHNKQWAAQMKQVGLYPSKTGEPGGKETGEQMTHYVISDGIYQRSARQLLSTGFTLSWAEYTEWLPDPKDPKPTKTKPKPQGRIKFRCPQCTNQAWGKPSLRIACVECMLQMVVA